MSEQDTITYGQLWTILGQLGYARDPERSGVKHVTYAHVGHGRPITLTIYPDDVRAYRVDVVTARLSLKLSLPEELNRFDRLLMDAGSHLFEYAQVT